MPDPDWTQHLTAEERRILASYPVGWDAETATVKSWTHHDRVLRAVPTLFHTIATLRQAQGRLLAVVTAIERECLNVPYTNEKTMRACIATIYAIVDAALQELPHA